MNSSLFEMRWHLIRKMLVISLAISLLSLAFPVYMINIYERVLSSRSEETLISITVILLIAFFLGHKLEEYRAKQIRDYGFNFDLITRPLMIERIGYVSRTKNVDATSLDIIDQIKNYYISGYPTQILEAFFIPIYILLLFALHPVLGFYGLFGCIGLGYINYINETKHKEAYKDDIKSKRKSLLLADYILKNQVILDIYKVKDDITSRWQKIHEDISKGEDESGFKVFTSGLQLKSTILIIQALSLGISAILVIENQVTPAVLFVVNMVIGKCLSPIAQLGAAWAGYKKTQDNFSVINKVLSEDANYLDVNRKSIPILMVEKIQLVDLWVKNNSKDELRGLSIEGNRGDLIGIFNKDGHHSSLIIDAMVGKNQLIRGKIYINSQDVTASLGHAPLSLLGYVNSVGTIFPGTIYENVSLFGRYSLDDVKKICIDFDINNDIVALKDGYQTEISNDSTLLGVSTKKMISVCRAWIGKPRLMLMEQPSLYLNINHQKTIRNIFDELKFNQWGIGIVYSSDPFILEKCNRIYEISSGKLVNEIIK